MPRKLSFLLLTAALTVLASCSINPATGERQFTALMPASSEASVGASENQKVVQSMGIVDDQRLISYVQSVGNRIVPYTERKDVNYTFTVVDSPVVNAFALPGGYVYVTRGLLALANSEAELAGVIGHEIGHVTARHSAERYSQGVLAQLGGAVLSTAINQPGASDLIGLGTNLYLTSYSRGQENQADNLGVRYMNSAGYDPRGMAEFLKLLSRNEALEAKERGGSGNATPSFLMTHPVTADRVTTVSAQTNAMPNRATTTNVDAYLNAINGMIYGDAPKDGFVRRGEFVHPQIGFAFRVPTGFRVQNQTDKLIGISQNGPAFVFDTDAKPAGMDPMSYIATNWAKVARLPDNAQNISVNGMRAATVQFTGTVNDKPADIRLVAVEWDAGTVFRFQYMMPQGGTPAADVEAMKTSTYSLRRLTQNDLAEARPKRIQIVAAPANGSVQALVSRMADFGDNLNEERFRTLNGINDGEGLAPGRRYKIIVD